MATVRVHPDEVIQKAIIEAATAFENRLQIARQKYETLLTSNARLIKTVRKIEEHMI